MLARVQNPSGLKGAAKVEFSFEGKDGKPKTFSEGFDLTGAREQVVKFSGKWKNPVLWDVENPNLYEMKVSLHADSKLADSYPAKDFGFREAWVEGSEFRMNGKRCACACGLPPRSAGSANTSGTPTPWASTSRT